MSIQSVNGDVQEQSAADWLDTALSELLQGDEADL